jgi:multimeric flavodoxin WrbA
MNVTVLNGSPRLNGNTATALDTVCEVLHASGIRTERLEIGAIALHGCIGCRVCRRKKDRRCTFDDGVNEMLETIFNADGLLIGSPVYFAGITGPLKCLLDRVFTVSRANGEPLRHKVGAGVVAVRRWGETPAWDQINKYFTASEMFVPPSVSWNTVFGAEIGEARQDVEGLHALRALGQNMAWLLHGIARAEAGHPLPPQTKRPRMNFIR